MPPPRPILPVPLTRFAAALAIFATIVCAYIALVAAAATAGDDPDAPLPAADLATGPCTLWFVGSSTIAGWTGLDRDFAPWDVHNRGVNAALLPAITRRFDRSGPGIPAAIIVYAGENDIAAGASAAKALVAFERFMATKTRRYGRLPVVAIALKPGPARWHDRPRQTKFNTLLERLAARRADLSFVDIRPLMLAGDRPGPFYIADGIHMNARGYARWTPLVRRAVRATLAASRLRQCDARTSA